MFDLSIYIYIHLYTYIYIYIYASIWQIPFGWSQRECWDNLFLISSKANKLQAAGRRRRTTTDDGRRTADGVRRTTTTDDDGRRKTTEDDGRRRTTTIQFQVEHWDPTHRRCTHPPVFDTHRKILQDRPYYTFRTIV